MQRHQVPPLDLAGRVGGGSSEDEEADEKYAKRGGGFRRSMQRVLPALFPPGLPISMRCALF